MLVLALYFIDQHQTSIIRQLIKVYMKNVDNQFHDGL